MKVRDSNILAWVPGQRKMIQVLGAFGLLDFTMLGSFSLSARFETYELFFYLILKFLEAPINRGY
jgi:hypothetical protein